MARLSAAPATATDVMQTEHCGESGARDEGRHEQLPTDLDSEARCHSRNQRTARGGISNRLTRVEDTRPPRITTAMGPSIS